MVNMALNILFARENSQRANKANHRLEKLARRIRVYSVRTHGSDWTDRSSRLGDAGVGAAPGSEVSVNEVVIV